MKTFDEIRRNSLTEATAGDHEEAAMAHEMAAKSVRQDLRAKKAHERAAEHHYAAADHIEDGNHEKANASHVKAKNAAATAKQYGNKHSANAHADTHAVKRVPSTVGEAKSADVKPEKYTDANGKTKIRMVPVVRENDANEATSPADLAKAMAAYKAKGGKVTKAPAAKAQGYHGKDDPGKDIAGIMDRPDTKKMGTRKKVKSMEGVDEAKRTVTIDRPDRLTSMRVSKDKPPFDNAKPMQKDTKDRFGNPIKNRAKHLARKAARDLANKEK